MRRAVCGLCVSILFGGGVFLFLVTLNNLDLTQVFAFLSKVSAPLTAITAVAGIVLSVYGYVLQKKTAAANVKPLLKITEVITRNESIKVYLRNYGPGSAVITSINFHKGDRDGLSLRCVLDEATQQYYWENWEFGDKGFNYLLGRKKIMLFRFSLKNLMEQGLSEPDARRILASAIDQVNGTIVCIRYQDVLKNEQKDCDTVDLSELSRFLNVKPH